MTENLREKRIFTMDRVSHQQLGILSKQVRKTMSEVVIDAVDLLGRLMFITKCNAGVQFDSQYDREIYDLILEYYFYELTEKRQKDFKEELKKIQDKAKEKHEQDPKD